MAEQEGVIQFAYHLEPPVAEAADAQLAATLNAWRRILQDLRLLGQDVSRYGGVGFGDISVRCSAGANEFIISANQTWGVPQLANEHLVRVKAWNLDRFWVECQGQQPPSSETLTHAMIYAADARINWVVHGQSQEIWGNSTELAIPQTPASVGYGSPEMTSSVAELLDANQSRPLVFAAQGHQDGIFSCGPTARDTGGLLVSYLAKALSLESPTAG